MIIIVDILFVLEVQHSIPNNISDAKTYIFKRRIKTHLWQSVLHLLEQV